MTADRTIEESLAELRRIKHSLAAAADALPEEEEERADTLSEALAAIDDAIDLLEEAAED